MWMDSTEVIMLLFAFSVYGCYFQNVNGKEHYINESQLILKIMDGKIC